MSEDPPSSSTHHEKRLPKSPRTASTIQRKSTIHFSIIPILIVLLLSLSLAYQTSETLIDLPDISREREFNKTALVLTAHPDDEAMFFSPTIISLINSNWDVRALCISSGNSSGLGDLRAQELYDSYMILGVTPDKVELSNHPSLQDGMDKSHEWDPALIANIVSRHLSKYPASIIITFDHKGITNHPNHVPLSYIRPLLPKPKLFPRPRLLVLNSPSIWTKFTGPSYAVFYTLVNRLHLSEVWQRILNIAKEHPKRSTTFVIVASPLGYIRGLKAMLKHQSQLVWFRWLYLGFSRLMWVNELVEMN